MLRSSGRGIVGGVKFAVVDKLSHGLMLKQSSFGCILFVTKTGQTDAGHRHNLVFRLNVIPETVRRKDDNIVFHEFAACTQSVIRFVIRILIIGVLMLSTQRCRDDGELVNVMNVTLRRRVEDDPLTPNHTKPAVSEIACVQVQLV